jgi:hypothetical protein
MDSYFLTFKDNSPLARYFLEMVGFEKRETAKQYAKAHFPLDYELVLTPEEFAPLIKDHPTPLGIAEYSIGVMIGCL